MDKASLGPSEPGAIVSAAGGAGISVQDGPSPQLDATRTRLGGMLHLRLDAGDWVASHRRLGESVQGQVHKILKARLDGLTTDQFGAAIRAARRCRAALEKRIRSPHLTHPIRWTLEEYLCCLSAWSDGVQLGEVQHPRLRGSPVDGQPVTPQELALLLQDDHRGCQTGILREQDGSVTLWHTEEDVEERPGSRFDGLRLASFCREGGCGAPEVSAFIYPDLLPGPAFGWRSDSYVQAVDSLYLKRSTGSDHLLSNIAVWVTLRLGMAMDAEQIVEALAPFVDGYAILTVQPADSVVHGRKIEFAGDQASTCQLSEAPGSLLFQVNVFSRSDAPIALAYESIDANLRQAFEQRTYRTAAAISGMDLSEDTLSGLFDLLASQDGGEYAYANEHVKAYVLCRVYSGGLRVAVGAGPALARDRARIFFDLWGEPTPSGLPNH